MTATDNDENGGSTKGIITDGGYGGTDNREGGGDDNNRGYVDSESFSWDLKTMVAVKMFVGVVELIRGWKWCWYFVGGGDGYDGDGKWLI